MTTLRKLAAGAATTALLAALAGAAHAQETTGAVSGTVTDAAGKGVAGAQVTVTFLPTNTTRQTTTSGAGEFNLSGLQTGGPYTIVAQDAGHAPKTLDNVQISLGSPYTASLVLDDNAGPTVVVRATRSALNTLQTGPRSSFTSAQIETLPSFNRDLKDIARLNPFVTIDPTNSNALVIAGNSNRSNTIYVDGAKVSDDFGLNGNGYPGQRSPFSIDIVQSFNVEIAPMDVQYGSFTGGILNVATKTGGNEFHGGGFYEYDSDKLGSGEEIRDRATPFNFKEKNYGLNLNGPIVKDKLFFVFNYEKYESQINNSFGPSDSDALSKVPGVTTADVTRVQNILKSKYGFDPLGTTVTSPLPITDEKYLRQTDLADQRPTPPGVLEAQSTEVASHGTPAVRAVHYRKESLMSCPNWLHPRPAADALTAAILYSQLDARTSRHELSATPDATRSGNISNVVWRRRTTRIRHLLPGHDGTAGGTDGFGGLRRHELFRYQANELTEPRASCSAHPRQLHPGPAHTFLLPATSMRSSTAPRTSSSRTCERQSTPSPASRTWQAGNAYGSFTYGNSASTITSASGVVPLDWGDVIHTFYLQDEWRLLPRT